MPNAQNIASAKEILSKIFPYTEIIFEDKDLGGTNKDVMEFSAKAKNGETFNINISKDINRIKDQAFTVSTEKEDFYFIIIEPPEKNPAHGIKAKKGVEIIKFMQKIASLVGYEAEQDVFSINKVGTDEIPAKNTLPYAGVEIKGDEKKAFIMKAG